MFGSKTHLNLLALASLTTNEAMSQVKVEFLSENGVPAVALAADTSTPEFTPEQQQLIDEINESINEEAQELFGTLLSKYVGYTLDPVILQNDFKGESLLQRIHNLTRTTFAEELEGHRDEIIVGLLHNIEHPGEIKQGVRSVCAACMALTLYEHYPAEAVRIITGLLTTEGEVGLLKEGVTLRRPESALRAIDTLSPKAISSQLFFYALMDLMNGEQYDYCAVTDMNRHKEIDRKYRGTHSNQIEILYQSIYNIDSCAVYNYRKNKKRGVGRLLKNMLPGSMVALVNWEIIDKKRLRTKSSAKAKEKSDPTPKSHFILVVERQFKHVYYRNLEEYESGVMGSRWVCDREKGLESMTEREFLERVEALIVPSTGQGIPKPQYKEELEQ